MNMHGVERFEAKVLMQEEEVQGGVIEDKPSSRRNHPWMSEEKRPIKMWLSLLFGRFFFMRRDKQDSWEGARRDGHFISWKWVCLSMPQDTY